MVDLDELERLEKDVPRDWKQDAMWSLDIVTVGWHVARVTRRWEEDAAKSVAIAKLIVAARNALPELLARIRELEAERARLQGIAGDLTRMLLASHGELVDEIAATKQENATLKADRAAREALKAMRRPEQAKTQPDTAT